MITKKGTVLDALEQSYFELNPALCLSGKLTHDETKAVKRLGKALDFLKEGNSINDMFK